jgi:putative ABC transport system ATP-binding protein
MIQLERVSHFYDAGGVHQQVLFDVTATISAGEIVLLTGPSGSGKSTLLSLIGALRSTQAGSLTVLGQELCGAAAETLIRVRRQIGFIFQAHNLLDCLTVRQNVEVALAVHGSERRSARRRAAEMLEAVGLSAYLDRHPRQLSGGQQQRVAIARALAARPPLILADEPTAALDSVSGGEVATRIRDLARHEGCSAVVVTHDHRILQIADRVLHIEDGRLRDGSTESDREGVREALPTQASRTGSDPGGRKTASIGVAS